VNSIHSDANKALKYLVLEVLVGDFVLEGEGCSFCGGDYLEELEG